jgi:hypothetical protein
VEGHCSKLERPAARISDLLLGPPPSRAWLDDHLDEATGQLREELAAQRKSDVELEALRSSVVEVQELVLGDVNGTSSLVMSMFKVAEQLEGRIDATTANGIHWGSCSALVATVLHFLKLDADLEVLKFRRNGGLTEGKVYTLWSWVHTAVDSLALHIPSSVGHNPPDSTGE